MIELRVLGTLDLRDPADGRSITAVLAQPKRTGLLAYLALASGRGATRRDTLLLLFWPNSTEDRARNSLNQAVFNLRRSLGENVILGVGEELRADGDLLWCDAVAFDRALTAGDARGALSLYGGDLLVGFHLDECVEFERWLDGERARLRERAVAAALALAVEEERGGNGVAALELLRRAVAWAPYEESAVLQLVGLLARLGDRAGALREYERFRKQLTADLALSPSRELEALATELRRGDEGAGTRGAGARSGRQQPGPIQSAAGATAAGPGAETGAGAEAVPPVSAARSRRRKRFTVGIAAAAALVLALALVAVSRFAPAGQASSAVPLDPKRVLVAAFENRTGDPALDPLSYMASDWIAQGIVRSGLARAVPFSTVVQETPHLRAEGGPPEVAIPTANRQLAQRIGAGILITGAYYRSGDSLALQAHVIDARTGELVRGIEELRGPAARPALVVEELQRRSLGALSVLYDERLESWPDASGQPANIEAYRLFSEGMSAFMRGMGSDWRAPGQRQLFSSAAHRFMAAAALDSSFVMPLLWAGYAYINRGDPDSARVVLATLERRPLSRWNQAVLGNQLAHLAGDREGEYQTARELAELSPDSEWLMKLARSALETGRYDESLRTLLRMDPERGWLRGWTGYWRLRAEVQHAVGNEVAALEDARRGLSQRPDDDWLRTQELWALAALGRVDELIASLRGPVSAGDPLALWRLNSSVEEMLGHGRGRESRRLIAEMLPLIPLSHLLDTRTRLRSVANSLPGARFEHARLLERAGREEEAATLYAVLLQDRPNAVELRVRAAVLLARRGDRRPAVEALARLDSLTDEQLERVFPRSQLRLWGTPRGWLSVHQARLLVQLGEPARAIERLQSAVDQGLAHVHLNLHDDPDFEPLRRHAAFQRLIGSRG